MNKNNNEEFKQPNDYVQEPWISFRFNDNVRKLPASKFNMLVYREVMKHINNIEINENLNSEKFARSSNIIYWNKQYNDLSIQVSMYEQIIKKLETDLKTNKLAQPIRNCTFSVNLNVNIFTEDTSSNNKVPEIIEISDDDIDQPIYKIHRSTTSTLVDKKQETKSSSINLVGTIEEVQKLVAKCKPDSKTTNFTPNENHNNNSNNKVMHMNVEACTSNMETCLSKFTCKRKPGPKSKTKCIDNEVNSDDVNNEISTIVNTKDGNNKINCNPDLRTNGLNNENYERFLSKINNQNIKSIKIPKLAKTPYPTEPPCNSDPSWKNELPAPILKIENHINKINKVKLIWDMKLDLMMAKIIMFELFVYQETSAIPNSSMWTKLGDIKVHELPMACDLHKFTKGYTYYFALRAVDVHKRKSPFAVQKTTIME